MATLNEEPQNHLYEQSAEHIVKENIHQVNENHVKEDSDCDKELFQSSINNPIIIQNKLNNANQQEIHQNEEANLNGHEQRASPKHQENQQPSSHEPEQNPKIQRYSDAIIQDITNLPSDQVQENNQEKEEIAKNDVEISQNNSQSPQNQNAQTEQQQQNEVVIEEDKQKTQEQENQQASQDEQKTKQNNQQESQSKEISQEEIQKFAQIFGVANAIKDQAKVCVQKKQYKDAIKLYEESLQVIHISNFQLGADKSKYKNILKEQVELALMLLCNISLCYFNEGEFEKSLEYAQKVSVINPNHLKAAYRRALALKKLQRYEKAFEEIKNARLIAIGLQQVDENINKEYKIIKQLYTEEKSKIQSQNNSAQLLSSSGSNNKNKNSQNFLNNSSLTNVSQFLDNNFPGSMKTTPFYLLCSSFTTYVVLKKFMNIRLLSKPAIIGGPLLSLGLFGFLQGKNIFIKLLCGGLVGLIGSFLYRYSDLISPKQLTLL
ncbi:hypothetical protein ABPG74_009955 [Tetrahymena malaccensis]